MGASPGKRRIDALVEMLDELDGRRDGRVTAAQRDGSATPAVPALEAIAERSNIAALRALARAGDPRQGIAFVGMTESSSMEARALRRQVPLWLSTDRADGADAARGGDGVVHDLARADERARFVASLGLPRGVANDVERVLANAVPRSRRELAMLALAWAPAYRDEPIPSRLVVSGHGTGETFFETDDDELRTSDLLALGRAMPDAATKIRSIHLAACQHGYETRMARWREVFTGVESMWGYAAFSPTGGTAIGHQAVWERRTRVDPSGGGRLSREDVRGTRRAAGVAVWTRDGGWTGPDQRPLHDIVLEARGRFGELDRYFRGELEPEDPGHGFLADTYGVLQELTSHLDYADQRDSFRATYADRLETALRLRFFRTNVAPRFDRAHRRENRAWLREPRARAAVVRRDEPRRGASRDRAVRRGAGLARESARRRAQAGGRAPRRAARPLPVAGAADLALSPARHARARDGGSGQAATPQRRSV